MGSRECNNSIDPVKILCKIQCTYRYVWRELLKTLHIRAIFRPLSYIQLHPTSYHPTSIYLHPLVASVVCGFLLLVERATAQVRDDLRDLLGTSAELLICQCPRSLTPAGRTRGEVYVSKTSSLSRWLVCRYCYAAFHFSTPGCFLWKTMGPRKCQRLLMLHQLPEASQIHRDLYQEMCRWAAVANMQMIEFTAWSLSSGTKKSMILVSDE